MSAVLTGNDTTILNERILKDFPDTDVVNIEYPDNLVEPKNGKNGNTIYAFNAAGRRTNVTIRVLAGSSDDKYLQAEIASYLNDPAAYTLIAGEFIKRVGDGKGNITNIIYQMKGGIIQKIPNTKENVSGDTEQAVTSYLIVFANTPRTIG